MKSLYSENTEERNIQFRKPKQNRKNPECLLQTPRINADFIRANFSSILPARVAPCQVKFISPAASRDLKGGTNQGRSLSDFPVCSCPFSLVTMVHYICKSYLNSESLLGSEEPNRRRWKPAALLLPRCGRWEKREELLSCCHDCKEKGFTMWRANHFKMLHPLRMCMNLEGKFHTKHSEAVIRTSV